MSDQETKDALKEALKEWLDEKFAMFGKWSLSAIGAATLGLITYLLLIANGWHKVGQ